MTKADVPRGGPQVIPHPVEWRKGQARTWAVPEAFTLDVVERAVSSYTPTELLRGPAVDRPKEPGRRSAVLIAVYEGDRGPTTILTRRPPHMRKHASEIAFPGGSHDDTDASMWHTAIREAHEEVALDPLLPRFVGEIDRFVTGASFSLVQPIVAALDVAPELTASPDEVDLILHVPLVELMTPGVYRIEEWFYNDEWRTMHFFDLVGETVWGATALMLHNLLSILDTSGPDPAVRLAH